MDENFKAAQDDGFFRKDAALVIINVSDETDICDPIAQKKPRTWDEKAGREEECPDGISHEQVRQAVRMAKGDQSTFFVTVANLDPDKSYPTFRDYGLSLVDLASGSDGALIDIEVSNYASQMAEAGKRAAESFSLKKEHVLSKPVAEPASVRVKVDGQDVNFHFDVEQNKILFEDAGEYGSKVEVEYLIEQGS
jgi:hypothetical protein